MPRPESVVIDELRDVECALSPENLTGDGEFSRSEVKMRSRQLRSKRQMLVIELGREPTSKELYGY